MIDWMNITIEDLAANPKKFGLPTFKEFSRSKALRDKYSLKPEDGSMVALEHGPTKFRKDLLKIKFKVNGVPLPNIEAVEKAIGDHGYTLGDLELGRDGRASKLRYKTDIYPQGGGKYDIVVDILP